MYIFLDRRSYLESTNSGPIGSAPTQEPPLCFCSLTLISTWGNKMGNLVGPSYIRLGPLPSILAILMRHAALTITPVIPTPTRSLPRRSCCYVRLYRQCRQPVCSWRKHILQTLATVSKLSLSLTSAVRMCPFLDTFHLRIL